MAWEHQYSAELQILIVNVTGLVDRLLWERQLRSSIQEADTYSCYRFLVDYRKAELRLDLVDLYDRPALYEETGMPRTARIAIMLGPNRKDSQFIETVTANRGYSVRIFEDRDEAIAWLRSQGQG